MVMEGQVKQYDFTHKKDFGGETIKPKDNLCGSLSCKMNSTIETSEEVKVSKTQWQPGKIILGKKKSKVNLRQLNEYNYRSDRLSEVEVPVQKVTKKKQDKE
jgi:hypothetical protein